MGKVGSFAAIAALIILGKLTGFFKDIVLTFFHGVSVVTDAYFLSNALASLVYMAVYMSIPVLIVPRYAQLLRRADRSEIDRNLSSMLMFPNELEAQQAVAAINHHQMNRQCFVGRPDASFKYWLAE